MTISKPAASPACWGLKYQDGDQECEQCPYNETCRSRVLEIAAATPARSSTPSLTTPYKAPVSRTPTGVVPMPPRPAAPSSYAPPASQFTAQLRYSPVPTPSSPPASPQQTQPSYSQYSAQGYSVPDPNRPNPASAMHRPGAQGPAYYFNQYPGEGVGVRLTKNMFLRGLEAIFEELKNFFRHWTWPPRS